MKQFKEFNESQEYLEEKLLLINNGKKYGQIVFLAGGAGSGKGFASTNFMEKEKFKVRDVDEWKTAFLKIGELKNKYPEIKGLHLKKPADVAKLHAFIEKLGIKDNTMNALLSGMKNKKVLPNIMFDITGKNINSIAKMMPNLLNAGYNPADIHMVWVLTDYQLAVTNNRTRPRIVQDDILFQTHTGAANTMFDLIKNKGKKLAINGEIKVILNNLENTIHWKDDDAGVSPENRTSGKYIKSKDGEKLGVIKDFTYITIKRRGKPNKTPDQIMQQLYQWIVNNIPESELQKELEDRTDTEPKVLRRP
jgi:dephospho-CoA kinase